MSANYRLAYASTSPRAMCANCGHGIRSGDMKFTAFNTCRHLDCVTSMEVLKLWQHCKSFEGVPGFSSLEYGDRAQVQALFKTLLLSTPMHAQGMMRAKLAAAAAAASGGSLANANAASATAAATRTPTHTNVLRREPSNDAMMTESSSSPPLGSDSSSRDLFAMSTSPDVPHAAAAANRLPATTPALAVSHSTLASHMSALSCSTPTSVSPVPPAATHPIWSPAQTFGNVQPSVQAHQLGLAQPPLVHSQSLGTGAIVGGSPHIPPRALHPHPHAQRGATSSLDPRWNAASAPPVAHTHSQPPSPHSTHTSPIPFAHLAQVPLHAAHPLPIRNKRRYAPEEDPMSVAPMTNLTHVSLQVRRFPHQSSSAALNPCFFQSTVDADMADVGEEDPHANKKRKTVVVQPAR